MILRQRHEKCILIYEGLTLQRLSIVADYQQLGSFAVYFVCGAKGTGDHILLLLPVFYY